LKKAEKVIHSFRELAPNALIVGFKLLVSPTEAEKNEALVKILKHVDLVVYNDLTELRKGNTSRYVYNGDEHFPVKVEQPSDLVDYILKYKKEIE
jgi:hypothetical protein